MSLYDNTKKCNLIFFLFRNHINLVENMYQYRWICVKFFFLPKKHEVGIMCNQNLGILVNFKKQASNNRKMHEFLVKVVFDPIKKQV